MVWMESFSFLHMTITQGKRDQSAVLFNPKLEEERHMDLPGGKYEVNEKESTSTWIHLTDSNIHADNAYTTHIL